MEIETTLKWEAVFNATNNLPEPRSDQPKEEGSVIRRTGVVVSDPYDDWKSDRAIGKTVQADPGLKVPSFKL